MERTTLTTAFLFALTFTHGQNLVPNGSFEAYMDCPDYWNQLAGNVVGWNVCSPSPDYFNACRDSSDFGVPFNWRGYQEPSEGNGYIGVGTFLQGVPMFREYACTELTEPLSIGNTISLSMKVALGGFGSYAAMSPRWTSKGIGMRLSTQPFVWPQNTYPNSAQLFLNEVLSDTTSWITLNGLYVPDSAYQYVTIGNFFEDSLSAPVLLDESGGTPAAYVYIDQVCVTYGTDGCTGITNVGSMTRDDGWSVITPFFERLEVMLAYPSDEAVQLTLFDLGGRSVAEKVVPKGEMRSAIPINGLSDGSYILIMRLEHGSVKAKQVLHLAP